MAKIGQQKWYHLRIFHLAPLNPLKLNPLLTSEINKKGGLTWYHSKKGPNLANKKGTILEKAQNS